MPALGIVAPLERDSLVYASGFRLIGESVGRMLSPALSVAQFEQNLVQIRKARCKVLLCNVFMPSGMKLTGPEVMEDRVLAHADTVFSRAARAGISIIVLGSGGARRIPEGVDSVTAARGFIQLCGKLAGVAKKHGITIALESLQSSETNFLNTLQAAATVVRAVNHPNFRLNADIFHMMRENESPQQIIAAANLLVYSEIAEKELRSYPGVKGDDFKPYLRALRKAKYSGPLFIEGSSSNPEKDMPIAFNYLDKQLREVYAE